MVCADGFYSPLWNVTVPTYHRVETIKKTWHYSQKITFCVLEENQMVSKINLRESKIDVLWSMYRTCSFGSSCGEVNYGVRDLGRWKGHDPQKKMTRGGNWNLQKVGEHWINFDKGGKSFFSNRSGNTTFENIFWQETPNSAGDWEDNAWKCGWWW